MTDKQFNDLKNFISENTGSAIIIMDDGDKYKFVLNIRNSEHITQDICQMLYSVCMDDKSFTIAVLSVAEHIKKQIRQNEI